MIEWKIVDKFFEPVIKGGFAYTPIFSGDLIRVKIPRTIDIHPEIPIDPIIMRVRKIKFDFIWLTAINSIDFYKSYVPQVIYKTPYDMNRYHKHRWSLVEPEEFITFL